jgi:outer membrane protease
MLKIDNYSNTVSFHGKDMHFFRPMTYREALYGQPELDKKIKYYYKQNRRYKNFNKK